MKILIDIYHPARVHLFRNIYNVLIDKGHEVKVIYREKEMIEDLLKIYNIPATKIGENKNGRFSKLIEFIRQFSKTFFISLNFKPDLYLSGASPILGWNKFIFRNKYIAYCDTEPSKLILRLSIPFVNRVITPKSFLNDYGPKQKRIDSFKEMAYLHPKYFKPDASIFHDLKLDQNQPFIILRFIAWNALHDEGLKGIADKQKIKLVTEFSKYAKVFISSEANLPDALMPYKLMISPEKIHSVLYYSSLFYGESNTMAVESSLLGTPTVLINEMAKNLGYCNELRDEFNLMYFFDSNESAFHKGIEILQDPESKKKWQEKANFAKSKLEDLNQIFLEQIESIV